MTTENCLHEPGAARRDTLPQRLHGLDAVRSGALLLGIVLHSLLPFTDIVWMINDSERSIVAFEVQPRGGQRSRAVIADAKRVLREAWRTL